VAPAATPPAIVNRLNRQINAVLDDPEVRKVLSAQMIQVDQSTPEALRERIRGDVEKWRDAAAKAGFRSQ